MLRTISASLYLLLASTSLAAQQHTLPPPEQIDDGWDTTAPLSTGFDEAALADLDAQIAAGRWGNVHALAIERNGKLLFERYYTGRDSNGGKAYGTVRFGRTSLHDIRSSGKTIAAILVGQAIEDGYIPSLDTPLRDLLPDRAALLSGEKAKITLRHAMTMTSGLRWDELSLPYGQPGNDDHEYRSHPDPIGYVLSQPLEHAPGTHFTYSGGMTQTVAAILENATGLSLEEYALSRLFRPMGIRDVVWSWEIGRIPEIGAGLRLNLRDLAKFGRLLATDGRWDGRQIVASRFVEEMVSPAVSVVPPSEAGGASGGLAFAVDYGLFVWLTSLAVEGKPVQAWQMVGNGEQRVTVIPDQGLVVTMMSGNYVGGDDTDPDPWMPERMLVESIMPAISAD